MAKILLVEDDNNLREIYEARLQAEGYTIVSARDGEEALVIAKAEKPDLIISDVMMPRISGFEMLDILRNTPDLKDVKVIMLTALGQAEDKTRADALGADRYLVKSQVTLEDIVKAAEELLTDTGQSRAPTPPPTSPTPTPIPITIPPTPYVPTASITPGPVSPPTVDTQPVQFNTPAVAPPPTPQPATPAPSAASAVSTAGPQSLVPTTNTTPQTASGDDVMTEAIEDLVAPNNPPTTPSKKPTPAPLTPDATATSNQPDENARMPEAQVVAPSGEPADVPPPPPPLEETTSSNMYDGSDGVTVAHKKIIQPISDGLDVPTRSNLDDLLAKEGVALDRGEPHVGGTDNPSATTLPVPPHPPGHVIAPTEGTPRVIDPNSISL